MTRSEDRRRAVQGAWPRAVPLTRRERAAMELALEVLRGPGTPWARYCSALGVLVIADAVPAQPRRWTTAARGASAARLALWLRARLRADRGDCGPMLWRCAECSWYCDFPVLPSDFCSCEAAIYRDQPRRITPLWEACVYEGSSIMQEPCGVCTACKLREHLDALDGGGR